MQETVAAERVVVTSTSGGPTFNPCKQEGCILAFHGGNQHMNAKREMFTQIPQELSHEQPHQEKMGNPQAPNPTHTEQGGQTSTTDRGSKP